ncbi:plasmid replication protein, CyRepA1 family [Pseudomonas viridiflava]|uniref:plasmid replication protein, CyRepA1 family n=2 Tax=Pseudomonas viridiflava TaxID=33069 RepID=UPI000F02E7BC|nr:plasmid replication protein, CyRepA1 family [Pseudomonas viridiflava]
MTNVPRATGLSAFYADRFNSDPYNLMHAFEDEISSVAADASVKWSSVSDAVRLNGLRLKKYSKTKVVAIDSRYDGKVMVWGDLKQSRPKKAEHTPIEYPYLTFSNNLLEATTWSGFDALYSLWKQEHGVKPDATVENKRLEKQKARQAEREARRIADEEAEKVRAERIYAERMAYEHTWLTGERSEFEYEGTRKDGGGSYIGKGFIEAIGDEDGTAPYLVKKQISDIASRFKMKRMRDRHGVFTAVPLFDIHMNFLGLQRLYDDKKLQGTGVKMDGAHCIFGDIETASVRYSAEGFATGASIYLAELAAEKNVAVVVAFNVGNLAKVLQAYAKAYPAWRFHNAADNDQWKPIGNAGLLAAIDIHREHGHPGHAPQFELDEAEEAKARETGKGPTDWNDFHVLYGLKATAKALRARANMIRSEKDWYSYCLQRVSLSGKFAEKPAKVAINAGMNLVPIKYNTGEVIRRVLEQLPASAPNEIRPKLASFAEWIARQKLTQAQQLRSFSPEALQKSNVQYVSVQATPHPVHGGPMVPAHLADLIGSLEGAIILRAPMGSGKTEKVIAPVLQAATKGAYIAHRVSLMDDAATRLNLTPDGYQAEHQVDHYKWVMQSHMPFVSHLVCCVNSLTASKFYNADERSWFTTLETLCIDEATQVLRHTTTGPVDGRVKVMDSLIDAVSSAKRVLLCDADANDTVIEFCEMARPGQTITVIEIVGQNSDIRVDHGDDEAVWQLAVDQICAGRRVLVANDSAESAKKMAALIEERAKNGEIPSPRMLVVHSEVKADPDVEAFLSNPKDEALKYDVLIYSPAISSGVSMNLQHFECHFGLFSGNSVGPSDALQMLRRDRTARHYIVGIGHSSAQRETNPDVMYRGMLVAEDLVCQIDNMPDEYRITRKKTAFDKMFLSTVACENKARNNFANNLLLMLAAEGYHVQHLDLKGAEDELAEQSRTNRKFAGELVFSKRMDLIDSVSTPTEEEFVRLNRMELRSESESAQVDRFHIENQLCVDEISPDDVSFYDNRGIAKVVALELLQSTDHQAKAYDLAQRKARVVLTQHRFKSSAQEFLIKIFEILTIDRKSGTGQFTSTQCRAVLDLVKTDQNTLDLYNTLKLGRYVPTLASKVCATTLVKSIFDRLGLSLLKRKSNGNNLFAINPDAWSFVMGYVERRQAKNVHSLTTHDHESSHTPLLAPEAPDDAAPVGVLERYRDTLQCEGVSTDLKYPLNVAEKLFAVASACELPLGTPLARLIGALSPDVAFRFAEPDVDMGSVKWTLDYAAKLLRP